MYGLAQTWANRISSISPAADLVMQEFKPGKSLTD